jgi:hypothetical protein
VRHDIAPTQEKSEQVKVQANWSGQDGWHHPRARLSSGSSRASPPSLDPPQSLPLPISVPSSSPSPATSTANRGRPGRWLLAQDEAALVQTGQAGDELRQRLAEVAMPSHMASQPDRVLHVTRLVDAGP